MSTSAETAKRTFPDKRPLYYYITDRKQLARTGRKLPWALRRAIAQRVDFIQIREKDLSDCELYELTGLAVRLAQGTSCRILVNGRADIALAAGAHGVHLPAAGLPLEHVRSWLPRRFLTGISVHSRIEAVRARRAGADYVLVGHVLPTESKAGYGSPIGLPALQQICKTAGLPVLALGGIRPENIDSVIDIGADGIAGITLFQSAIDFGIPRGRQSFVR